MLYDSKRSISGSWVSEKTKQKKERKEKEGNVGKGWLPPRKNPTGSRRRTVQIIDVAEYFLIIRKWLMFQLMMFHCHHIFCSSLLALYNS